MICDMRRVESCLMDDDDDDEDDDEVDGWRWADICSGWWR
jgi:hypothetical protein